jgi:hypothetical protein
MFELREIKSFIFVVLIFSCFSYTLAGVHYIEVPKFITDEMMIEYSESTSDMILRIVKNELRYCDESEHATVILTRDCEPIFSKIYSDEKNREFLNKKIDSIVKKIDEDIDFYFIGEQWTDDQKKDVYRFLYEVESDEPGITGIYQASKKLFGDPYNLDDDYNVRLRLDTGSPVESIWIPRQLVWCKDPFGGGYYWAIGIGDGELILQNWRWNDPFHGNCDNDRAVFAENMYKIFLDCFYMDYDHFYEGMSRSAGVIMMNHFSQTYPNYNDIFHGQKTEENPGFIFYDNFNHPAISTSSPDFHGQYCMSNLKKYREDCANMAWFKAFESSINGLLFSDFRDIIKDYGLEHPGSFYTGLYIPPSFDKLCKIADGAWYEHEVDGPEGYPTFDWWRCEQYILTCPPSVPQLGVFPSNDKLRVCVYFPIYDQNGNYYEEPPHGYLPIRITIYNGTNIYDDRTINIAEYNGYYEMPMPIVDSLQILYCHVRIDDPQWVSHFADPDQIKTVAAFLQSPGELPQIMGVVPPDNTFNKNGDYREKDGGVKSTVWSLKDPIGGIHLLDIQNEAYILNIPNHPEGVDGKYQLYADGELYKTFDKDKKSFLCNAEWSPEEWDKNKNFVMDIYEHDLAERFKPEFWMHNTNPFYGPEPVEMFLCPDPEYITVNCGLLIEENGTKHRPGWPPDMECENMGDIFKKYNDNWNDNWRLTFGPEPEPGFEYHWNPNWYEYYGLMYTGEIHRYWWYYYSDNYWGVNSTLKYENPVYYNFWIDDIGRPFIQYWLFYPFNFLYDYPQYSHEGDWELVNVVFSCQDPQLAEPIEVVYFFHDHYLRVPEGWIEGWKTYWNIVNETHPVIYVGGDIWPGDIVSEKETNEYNKISSLDMPFYECTGASYPFSAQWINVATFFNDEKVIGETQISFSDIEVLPLEGFEYLNQFPWWCYFYGEWGRRTEDYVEYFYTFTSNNTITKNISYNNFIADSEKTLLNAPKSPTNHYRWRKLYGDLSRDHAHDGNCKEASLFINDYATFASIYKLKNNLLSNSTPYSFDSSGGYGPNSELSTLDNTTSDISLYPNPCFTSATISIPEKLENNNEPITISIYDISGRLVRKEITTSSFTWDLTSTDGKPVSNGIYLLNISTSNANKTLKLLVAR